MTNISRREWLTKAAVLPGALLAPKFIFPNRTGLTSKPLTILIVSGWQDVNIGDIAHTPGLLHVFRKLWPEAKLILWKKSKSDAAYREPVDALLRQNFPNVNIVYGDVSAERNVDSDEVRSAFREADLMVHGSGPEVVGQANLEAWGKASDKPFGIFGTTIQNVSGSLKALLEKASFIYTRETASLKVLEREGIKVKDVAFAPDATFYMAIRNDPKGSAFLQAHHLEDKRFICVVPRLRYTPYHKIRKTNWSAEKIAQVERVNAENKEKDHAKLREAMIAYIRETGNKVLVCPEMTYQVDIMDELLIDPLPEDVKPSVIKRGYWLPDEAASVYTHALAVLSFECHSPIIAIANGTPSFYLRQPEDTIKGQMYYDLGFHDWIFEIEGTTAEMIASRLREVWTDYTAAHDKIRKQMKKVDQIYRKRIDSVKKVAV